jgi:hypothetical protein
MEEALREACRRLAWESKEEIAVVRVDGPDGQVIER